MRSMIHSQILKHEVSRDLLGSYGAFNQVVELLISPLCDLPPIFYFKCLNLCDWALERIIQIFFPKLRCYVFVRCVVSLIAFPLTTATSHHESKRQTEK